MTPQISFVKDEKDTIQSVVAGDHQVVFTVRRRVTSQIVFVMKGPLYLVAVSRIGESEETLSLQLEHIHSQIIMFLTKVSTACRLDALTSRRKLLSLSLQRNRGLTCATSLGLLGSRC